MVLYFNLARKDEARVAWQELLTINPNATAPGGKPLKDMVRELYGDQDLIATEAALKSAISALNDNKYDSAKMILMKVIQDVNISTKHKAMAYYLYSMTEQNPDEAIIYCSKAAELDSTEAHLFFERLGGLYHEKKDYAKSLEMLDKAISISPLRAVALSMRGGVYREMGNIDKALADFDKAISLEPTIAIFYVRRGIARFLANQQDGALTDFTTAISKRVTESSQGICYYYMAKIYLQKNDYTNAKTLYQSALQHLADEEKKVEVQRILKQITLEEKWK